MWKKGNDISFYEQGKNILIVTGLQPFFKYTNKRYHTVLVLEYAIKAKRMYL